MNDILDKDRVGVKETVTEDTRGSWIKRVLIFGTLSILFSAAVFTTGRLLGDDLQADEPQDKEFVFSEDGNQVMGSGVQLEPDESLPDQQPTASGQLHHREDNSLFISQFPMTTEIVYLDSVDEWAIVEIVLTKDTRVYKDVTDFSKSFGGGTVQQEVVQGSIDEISGNSMVLAWGELRGERLVAEVIQYFAN
jgi:hypothetical protein